MAEPTEHTGGLLDARKAKAVFILGVALWLLMTFWSQAPRYKVQALESKGAQLDAEKSHEVEKPYLRAEPQKPPEKAKDFAKLTEQYNEMKKKWDGDKKKYDDDLIPAYQKEEWIFDNEDAPELREKGEELEREHRWAKATADSWCYWAFVGRFIATVLMLVGLAFTALNGNEWERAAAVLVIGLVLVGIGGALGR